MNFLKRIDSLFEQFERIVISYSIILMALVCIGNVISRNLFHYSWTYAEEVSQFAIIWVTFIGASYAARHGVHIRMSALYDQLGHGGRKVMMIIMTAGTAALMFALCYYASNYTIKLFHTQRMSPALRWPLYLIVMWVPVGLGMTGIQYALTCWKNLTRPDVYIAPDVRDGFDESDEFAV